MTTRPLLPTILLTVLAMALPACDRGAEPVATEPVPAPSTTPAPAADPTAGPAISFASRRHDFGRISDTRTYRCAYEFTNTGDRDLVIRDIKAACGCTVPTLRSRTIAPGETGSVEIRFDPKGKSGPTPKKITVVSNAVGAEVVELELTADIRPLVRSERFVRLGTIQLGAGRATHVRFEYDDADLRIENVSANNPNVTARVTALGTPSASGGAVPTHSGTLEVQVAPEAPWGLLYATRVTFDAVGRPEPDAEPVAHEYTVFITGQVYGDLRARPDILSISRMAPGERFDAAVTLTRASGEPFSIVEARIGEVSIPGVAGVRVATSGAAPSHTIALEGQAGSTGGSLVGTILITTDVPGEEALVVRFAGFIQS